MHYKTRDFCTTVVVKLIAFTRSRGVLSVLWWYRLDEVARKGVAKWESLQEVIPLGCTCILGRQVWKENLQLSRIYMAASMQLLESVYTPKIFCAGWVKTFKNHYWKSREIQKDLDLHVSIFILRVQCAHAYFQSRFLNGNF